MIWMAVEDKDCELSQFEKAGLKKVRCLMNRYEVNKHDVTRFRLQDDDGIVYEGVIYEGRLANLWIARKI